MTSREAAAHPPSRGEIWEVDWSPGRGSEQTGRRPALIVQNNQGNHSQSYPNTIVAAISTRGRPIPVHVFVRKSRSNGLRRDSYVKCEQIMTISKSRLQGSPWGRLTDVEMEQVDRTLSLGLSLY